MDRVDDHDRQVDERRWHPRCRRDLHSAIVDGHHLHGPDREQATGANGTVAYTTPQLQRNGGNPVTKVEIIVTNVTPPAGYTWNGVKPSVSANKP